MEGEPLMIRFIFLFLFFTVPFLVEASDFSRKRNKSAPKALNPLNPTTLVGGGSVKTRSSVQSAYPLFGLQEMSDLIGFFVMAHRVRMNDAG